MQTFFFLVVITNLDEIVIEFVVEFGVFISKPEFVSTRVGLDLRQTELSGFSLSNSIFAVIIQK